MNQTELAELIAGGESSGVEFKRDDIRPDRFAREVVALLNLEGGYILLGVEDDGSVTGLNRPAREAEEWVMEAARISVLPATIPFWETVDMDGKLVGVVTIPRDAPDKPYKARRGGAWVTHVRVGTTTRDATREEEERLYQQSGLVRYGLKPVVGSTVADLDLRRLTEYLGRILDGEVPGEDDDAEWERLLRNLELVTGPPEHPMATVNGCLLFGLDPRRLLPQSGIRAICYVGDEPDYTTRADEDIGGAMVPLHMRNGMKMEGGLVDQAWDFVRRNTVPSAHLEGMRRIDRWEYPEAAVREAVANAVVHRDYGIARHGHHAHHLQRPLGSAEPRSAAEHGHAGRHEAWSALRPQPDPSERDAGLRLRRCAGHGRAKPHHSDDAGAQRHGTRSDRRRAPLHRAALEAWAGWQC